MGNTFIDIWLTSLIDSKIHHDLLSSRQVLTTLPSFYCMDDANTVKSVQPLIRPQKIAAKPVEIIVPKRLKTDIKTKSVNKHTSFLKGACLCLVQECIDQLSIMISVDQTELGTIQAKPFVYQTLKDRFGGIGPDYDSYVIGEVYNDMHKIQKDLKVLITILNELYDEIDTFSGVTCLNTFIETYYKMRDEEEELLEECRRKQCIFQNLQRELKCDRSDTAKRSAEIETATINKLRELKDLNAYAMEALKYTDKWEKSRREQNIMSLEKHEGKYRSTIINMAQQLKDEDECHHGLETFYEESQLDFTNDIQNWINRYDTEIEQKDMEIYAIKAEIDKATEKLETVQEMYDKRTIFIAEYLDYKALKEEREKELAERAKQATKIQAWWRGVMVRKKLGPYAKKKKGKKGGKKNNKKKNKK